MIIESANFRLIPTISFHRLKNWIRAEGEGEGEERNAGWNNHCRASSERTPSQHSSPKGPLCSMLERYLFHIASSSLENPFGSRHDMRSSSIEEWASWRSCCSSLRWQEQRMCCSESGRPQWVHRGSPSPLALFRP